MNAMANTVHPLIFKPILRPKIWGGRALERLFAKALPPNESIGESWECADLPEGRSIVAGGPANGRRLDQLVAEWGPDLLGRTALLEGRFPFLIKFLDCNENLSVQVHPDPPTAARLGAARPKEEAWYVIEARPGACVYLGLQPGTTREAVRATLSCGNVEALLRRVPARQGDSFLVPGGTVHALGAGLVVAEIETPSDTTFRLFDWGRQRPAADAGMHVERALECIRFDAAGPPPPRSHVGGVFTTVTRFVESEHFVVEKVRHVQGLEIEVPYAELVVWIVLEGRGEIRCPPRGSQPFRAGDVVVLPAALKKAVLKTDADCAWLEVTAPLRSDLADFPRLDRPDRRSAENSAQGVVPLNVRTARPPGPKPDGGTTS